MKDLLNLKKYLNILIPISLCLIIGCEYFIQNYLKYRIIDFTFTPVDKEATGLQKEWSRDLLVFHLPAGKYKFHTSLKKYFLIMPLEIKLLTNGCLQNIKFNHLAYELSKNSICTIKRELFFMLDEKYETSFFKDKRVLTISSDVEFSEVSNMFEITVNVNPKIEIILRMFQMLIGLVSLFLFGLYLKKNQEDSSTVKTGDPMRDERIVNFFFTKDKKAVAISGKVKSIKKDKVEVEFNINGTKKVVPMTLNIQDTNATLVASIDVMDFVMGDNLSMLTEACKVEHEGKTWSTVDLNLAAQFSKNCK